MYNNAKLKDAIQLSKIKSKFKLDNCTDVHINGYDAFYLIKNDINLDENNDFEEIDLKDKKTSTIVKAFTKFSTQNFKNRVLLSHFVQIIS
jgi:hypothetical protein